MYGQLRLPRGWLDQLFSLLGLTASRFGSGWVCTPSPFSLWIVIYFGQGKASLNWLACWNFLKCPMVLTKVPYFVPGFDLFLMVIIPFILERQTFSFSVFGSSWPPPSSLGFDPTFWNTEKYGARWVNSCAYDYLIEKRQSKLKFFPHLTP